jgi:hypothetical protein
VDVTDYLGRIDAWATDQLSDPVPHQATVSIHKPAATHQIQVLVVVILWEFDSPRPHEKAPVLPGLLCFWGAHDECGSCQKASRPATSSPNVAVRFESPFFFHSITSRGQAALERCQFSFSVSAVYASPSLDRTHRPRFQQLCDQHQHA